MTSTIASHLPRAVGMALAIDRAAAWACRARGRRRDRPLLVRRRVAQPRDRAGGAQHDGADRVPGSAAAAAVRVRGQRARDQRADPAGWVESALTAREQIRYEIAYGHDPAEVLGVARSWPSGCASGVGRRCSTCARCGT